MISTSLRENLTKIGIDKNAAFSYRSFISSPPNGSLKEAMRSMNAPENWHECSRIGVDQKWTDEVQGVAWDGLYWMFSCNANADWNRKKTGSLDKSIFVFMIGKNLRTDSNWDFRTIYNEAVPEVGRQENCHWGQLCYYEGHVYVSFFWYNGIGTRIAKFKDNGGSLQFLRMIDLDYIKSSQSIDGNEGYPEFQAINPWDKDLYFYTSLGGSVHELFIHDQEGHLVMDDDSGKPKTLKLNPPPTRLVATSCHYELDGDGNEYMVEDAWSEISSEIQGACFSNNGHIYISCNHFSPTSGGKVIYCHSALNGHRFGYLQVPFSGEGDDFELEGICFAEVGCPNDPKGAQIHVVLLENIALSKDNMYLIGFSADEPDLV